MVALYGGGDPGAVASAIMTDTLITEPDRFLARRMEAAGEPVFVYHFSYVPAAARPRPGFCSHGS